MPKSIAIHNVDDAIATWLIEEAGRRGVSVDTVAGLLLRHGLEWELRQAELPTYHDLDALAGSCSEAEATAFLQAIADFEQVGQALWRYGTFSSTQTPTWPSNGVPLTRGTCSGTPRGLG